MVCVSQLTHGDPEQVDAAGEAASAFRAHAGTAEAIQDNLTRPLLSEENMLTPDGQAFAAQLTCHEADSFLEVLITPSGSGDIGAISIQQDTSMDGEFDSLYSAPFQVSGVCANGVISCTPGTWADCRAYAWVADESNRLDLLETGLNNLGGCYCVNNYCGQNLLVNNLDTVVTAVGGGAANALASRSPYYAITDVFVDGPLARYFGQDTADCGAEGPDTLTDYYSAPTSLSSDAFAASVTDEVYQAIAVSPAASQSELTSVSCDIRRSVAMDETNISDIIDYDGGAGSISPCGIDCLQLVLGQIGDNYWVGNCDIYEHNVRFNVLRPERIISATLIRAVWDDWIQIRANADLIWSGPDPWTGTGLPPGSCELATSWDRSLSVDFTPSLAAGGPVDFNVRVAVAGNGEGYAYARLQVDTECRLAPDVVADTCVAYQNDSACSLQDEVVDGVQTVQSFVATGLTPLPSTVTVNGSICSEDITRDWWEKHRTYACEHDGDFDFAAAIERKAFVHANATPAEYQDRIVNPDTGSIQISTGEMTLLNEIDVPTCVAACKTRKPRKRNEVGRSGVVAEQNTATDTYDIFYHECANNTCPITEGEELLKDCACVDEFAEASVVMQLIRQGGQDIICSSGIPQPLQ